MLQKFNEYQENENLKKVTIYYACGNAGDGSVFLKWFLTNKEASKWERDQDEGWGEDCTGSVETFEGSNVYNKIERR